MPMTAEERKKEEANIRKYVKFYTPRRLSDIVEELTPTERKRLKRNIKDLEILSPDPPGCTIIYPDTPKVVGHLIVYGKGRAIIIGGVRYECPVCGSYHINWPFLGVQTHNEYCRKERQDYKIEIHVTPPPPIPD